MSGLTRAQAAERLAQYGPNRLQPATQRAALLQFLAHFKNPLVPGDVVLLIAYLLAVEGGKQWFYRRLMPA